MSKTVECDRHGFPYGKDNAKPWPQDWYVHRCAHLGNSFIVDIRRTGSRIALVDFVIDEIPGDAKFVDGHEAFGDKEADKLWNILYERLIRTHVHTET